MKFSPSNSYRGRQEQCFISAPEHSVTLSAEEKTTLPLVNVTVARRQSLANRESEL